MKKKLQVFGYGLALIAVIFAIGGLLKHKHLDIKQVFLYISSALLLLITTVNYPSLQLAYDLWMKVAYRIGLVVTTLLLTLIFFLIFTPVALILRILGKDHMQRKWDSRAQTYWIKKEDKLFTKERYQQQF